MAWYVAHAVMVLRPELDTAQPFYCWENLLLIEAGESDDPWEIAENRARQVDSDDHYELRSLYGVPARWEFAGIRKVVEVRHDTAEGMLCGGDELTYNTLLIGSNDDLQAFVAGKECRVHYANDAPDDT